MNIQLLITRGLIPSIILATALATGWWLLAHPKEIKKSIRQNQQAILVKTALPDTSSYTIPVETMGQVIPATEIMLKPQVAGEILAIHKEFIPGGHLKKSDTIIKIDPADYKISVKKQKAILKQAEANYKLELGRQSIAKQELEILSRTTGRKLDNTALALRAPQLDQAKAEREKAESDLETAELDLQRTEIIAPFNSLITERKVTLGDKVSGQDTLATLVSTDEYWIELSLPVNELQWLDIPSDPEQTGSKAYIFMDGGRGTRTGTLLKLMGNLDKQSRFASILISVPDPLLIKNNTDKASPLILGDYVKVILDGRTLNNAVRIPLSWLRDDNIVWVAKDDKLIFKKIIPTYEDREFAYISSGLSAADRIIISDIPVPVDGMKIRTMEKAREDVQKKMIGPKGAHE